MGNHHLTYAYRLPWPTRHHISHRLRNQNLFNPYAFTSVYFLPMFIPYRKWIQLNILYWLVGHLYITFTMCDYWRHISAKRDWCIYFDTCQNFLDFSDYIVKHDNSSVHVQGSYGQYKFSIRQTELIDNWSTWYCPACYRYVRSRNLNSR